MPTPTANLAAAATALDAAVAAVTEALATAADFQTIEDAAAGRSRHRAEPNWKPPSRVRGGGSSPTRRPQQLLRPHLPISTPAITAQETAATAVDRSERQLPQPCRHSKIRPRRTSALAQADQITAQAALDAAAATLTAYDDAIAADGEAGASAAVAATAGARRRRWGRRNARSTPTDHPAVTDALIAATAASSAATGAHRCAAGARRGVGRCRCRGRRRREARQQLVDDLTALETALADDILDALDIALVDAANAAAIALSQDWPKRSASGDSRIGRAAAQDNLDDAQASARRRRPCLTPPTRRPCDGDRQSDRGR